MDIKKHIQYMGMTGIKVKKVVLEDGMEIELKNITHFFTMKLAERDGGAEFTQGFKIINDRDNGTIIHQLMFMAGVLNHMREGHDYEKAFEMQLDWINKKINPTT